MSKPSVFLSYARADDEPFVERLRDDLVAAGVEVWWDRESMANRGRTFLQELRDAIENVDRLVAVIGPHAVNSDYVRVEWEHAMSFAKGIIPVLRDGEWALASAISKLDGPDMRPSSAYEAGLKKLLKYIREPVAALGPFLTAIPALPPRFQARPEDLVGLHDLVLPDLERPMVVTSPCQSTLLQGMGGIGKSVLAAAFCRAIKVRRAFPDGIAWVTIGSDPDLLVALRTLGQALGDNPAAYVDLEIAKARLPGCLAGKKCLVVLDDVWDVTAATPFLNAVQPQTRLLITTRDATLLPGAQLLPVAELSNLASLRLLADWSGEPVDELPSTAKAVAKRCDNLPFALALCGAMRLDNETPWEELLDALSEADLTFLEHRFPNYELYGTVLRCLKVSVDALERDDPVAAKLYRLFPVFGADASVPEAAIISLWTHAAALKERHARKLLSTLSSKALLLVTGFAPNRQISMHDLQHDYLRSTVEDMTLLHQTLLDAYQSCCGQPPEWWHGPNDGYFFQRLPHHLLSADRREVLEDIAFDGRWVQAKVLATDVNATADDYVLFPDDRDAELVRDALRLSKGALNTDADLLSGQLLGRLDAGESERMSRLLATVADCSVRPWLRPVRRSLTPAGTPLVWWLKEGMSIVNSIAVRDDGAIAICSDEEFDFHFWNLVTGTRVRTRRLDGDEWISCMRAIPASGWALCGTDEGRFLILDFESGELVFESQKLGEGLETLDVSLDGRVAVAADSGGQLHLWDIRGRTAITQIDPNITNVSAIAIEPSGRFVYVAGDGLSQLSLDDPDSPPRCMESSDVQDRFANQVDRRVQPSRSHRVESIAISHDGEWLAAGASDGEISMWKLEDHSSYELRPTQGDKYGSHLSAIRFSHDSTSLVSVGWDGMLRWWDLASRREMKHLEHASPVYDLWLSADERLAVTATKGGSLLVWDPSHIDTAAPVEKHRLAVNAIRAVPEHGMVVSGSNKGTVKAWSLTDGKLLWSVELEDDGDDETTIRTVKTLAYDEQTTRFVAAYSHGLIRCLAPVDGTLIAEWNTSWGDQFPSLALARNGRSLLVASDDFMDSKGIALWRIGNKRASHVIKGVFGGSFLDASAVSADGTLAAVNRNDVGVQLIDLETREVIWVVNPKEEGSKRDHVRSVFIGERKRRLVVGYRSGRVQVWDLAQRGLIRESYELHSDQVISVALSADESTVLSLASDDRLKLWRVDADEQVACFMCDSGWSCGAFAGDDRHIVAGDFNGNVHILNLEHGADV